MRLLNANTFQLEQFYDNDIPPYAILSHTWTKDEVTFQEFSTLSWDDPRLEKTVGCCKQALQDDLTYVWVDTFCIDKASSAELSEAINSMYKWYGDSTICYVYLSDVHPGYDDDSFSESRWFTRGWTLQELLAPGYVRFFDSSWISIGQKYAWKKPSKDFGPPVLREKPGPDDDLSQELSNITSISVAALRHEVDVGSVSVAEKMSWAAERETTRSEDIAYSLLGIFGINMPLLYGEGGKRAFIRLQEEIISQTYDHTIFSWGFDRGPTHGGIFATSPLDFAGGGDIVPISIGHKSHYTVTNLGVQIRLPVMTVQNGVQYAFFDATRGQAHGLVMSIPLYYADGTGDDEDILVRDPCSMPVFMSDNWLRQATTRQLYLSKSSSVEVERNRRQYTLFVAKELNEAGYLPSELYPHATFSTVDHTTIYFGPWAPGEERLALVTYKSRSPYHPTFKVKIIYDDDRSSCLLRLADGGYPLVADLEPTASHEDYWALGNEWREVVNLGTLGDVSAKMEKLWPESIYCHLSLTPSTDSISDGGGVDL
ncbi:HET domain-containing protein [Fusarium keratoplasticum]|nr:HET domain-containing protein [Fusarium keratoplasticum]